MKASFVDIINRITKKCLINHETQEGFAKFDVLILHLSFIHTRVIFIDKVFLNLSKRSKHDIYKIYLQDFLQHQAT